MDLDFGCLIIKSALNSRSQETENQVFLLKSMGPANQNFVILSLIIANKNFLVLPQLVLKPMGPIT